MTPVEQDAAMLSRMTCGELMGYIRELSARIEYTRAMNGSGIPEAD